ncbi:MAG: hypothetical protein ACK48B_10880 [Dolichospermum sp.]
MNDETLVVRASCPLNMYLITPGSAVYLFGGRSQQSSCFDIIVSILSTSLDYAD